MTHGFIASPSTLSKLRKSVNGKYKCPHIIGQVPSKICHRYPKKTIFDLLHKYGILFVVPSAKTEEYMNQKSWFVFLTAILFVTANTLGQPDTTKVPFVAGWAVGDTFHFNITKIKQTWQDKKMTQNDSSQYLAHFEVIDADTSAYTIRWRVENALFNIFNLPGHLRKKLSRYEVTNVIYTTDKTGAFIGIQNWQDISNMITLLMEESIDDMAKNDKARKAELKKALEPLFAVYNTKRGIELLIFNELQIIHFPFGRSFERGEFYNYKEQLPNLLGGDPIDGDGIIFVKNVDYENNRCLLVQRMRILPDKAKAFLTAYLREAGLLEQALPQTLNESAINTSDENSFEYHFYPGIPIRLNVRRESTVKVLQDNVRKIDQTIVERIEP